MKTSRIFVAILLITLMPALWLMVSSPLYWGYDVLQHIGRIEQFHASILEKQIPPRLAPTLIHGNTYPLFVVNYQLPYYFAEIFMIFTNDPVLAFKSVMAVSYILSAIFAFLFFKTFGSSWAALVGTVVFSYLPYRFANLYFRGSLGESVALMFVPLVLLALNKVATGKKLWDIWLALAIFGIITAHTLVFLIFAPLFLTYVVFLLKLNKKTLRTIILATILGFLMSSFQLLPAFFEKQYMKFDEVLLEIYKGHFINFFQLLRLPASGINLGTYLQSGIVSAFLIILGIISLILRQRKELVFFIVFALTGIFMTIKQSLWIWDNFDLVKNIVYPWRFISLIIFCTGATAIIVVDSFKSRLSKVTIGLLLIATTIYSSRHYFLSSGHNDIVPALPTLTAFGETDPIWSNGNTLKAGPLIVSDKNVELSKLVARPFEISFKAEVLEPTSVIIRRMYFPGWNLKVNGKNKDIEVIDGFVSAHLEYGKSQVEISFKETPVRKTANSITLFSLIAFLALTIIKQNGTFKFILI